MDEVAVFAGGCFWCVQYDFDDLPGVLDTYVGYTGGDEVNPTYPQVSSGSTGHIESVKIIFDPNQVSYPTLLDHYFHNIDPTRNDGQFCDKGKQYRPAIFYTNKEQKKQAEEYKNALIKSERFPQVLVEILPLKTFYIGEEYHQHYYDKNPFRYKYYRFSCGRDKRLKQLWEK